MNAIIGIDVSKEELVIYCEGCYWDIGNCNESLEAWYQKQLEVVKAAKLVAYEATGGYEKIVGNFFKAKGIAHCRLHANHVRAYAQALGQLAKTDKLDAKVIAEFAEATVQRSVSREVDEELIALVQRREQLLELRTQETNRLETLTSAYVRNQINEHVEELGKKLAETEKRLASYVASKGALQRSVNHLCSIPGVGLITAVSVLSYLPELSSSSSKQLSALCGLAPMNKDSGKRKGYRRIMGGRSQVRRVLYMAALSSIRCNPSMKAFYEHLRSRGKCFKLAITATMRKLLSVIRSVAVRETNWEELRVSELQAQGGNERLLTSTVG